MAFTYVFISTIVSNEMFIAPFKYSAHDHSLVKANMFRNMVYTVAFILSISGNINYVWHQFV